MLLFSLQKRERRKEKEGRKKKRMEGEEERKAAVFAERAAQKEIGVFVKRRK